MPTDFIRLFPKPFLDDLVAGRMLPIIGAGLSRNAVTQPGTRMPLWDDFGKAFAKEMTDCPFSGVLDAISAYAHEFGRTRLVERLTDLLLVQSAKPGQAHEAFCTLQFTIVCTTNFDFLLEQQYLQFARYCRPIIDEDQLGISARDTDIVILKLHGDLNHPQRLVVTEDDYDRFLDTYPLLATYLANLLITRTPLLIGYSLDDPDFRQVWQIVIDRLGRLRRPAYALAVDASPSDVSRFQRRGVRLISLPGAKADYSSILAATFRELRDYWAKNIVAVSQVVREDSLAQLSLPWDTTTRLCFFAVPVSMLSFYRENAYPLASKHGFVPFSANDMISPGDNWLAKIETLIARSEVIVVDASTKATLLELEFALSKLKKQQVFVISEEGASLPIEVQKRRLAIRAPLPGPEPYPFLQELDDWLGTLAASLASTYHAEPVRLLSLGEYRAAIMSAIVLLEVLLRDMVTVKAPSVSQTFPMGVRMLVDFATKEGIVDAKTSRDLMRWSSLRNSVTHSLTAVSKEQAEELVNGVLKVIDTLSNPQHRRRSKKA